MSMKQTISLLIIAFPLFLNAQKIDDTKIIVTLPDNINLYKKVKIALVNSDFIVRDNYNTDTLTTYPREFSYFQGHCRIMAVIHENTITLSGVYGLKSIDEFGYTQSPKEYKKIMYYKGSKGWAMLNYIAELIGGQITYGR